MFNLKVFNSEAYREFLFGEDYLKICTSVTSIENVIFAEGDYFIAPAKYEQYEENNLLIRDDLYTMSKKDYTKIHSDILVAHNLFAGKIIDRNNYLAGAGREGWLKNKFNIQLLYQKLDWARQFSRCICEHLSSRESEGKFLLGHSNVRMMVADVAIYLRSAQALLESSANKSQLNMVAEEVIKAIGVLARLSGGRAFLHGSVVSMLWLFEMFRNVYFMQGEVYE